ncbi:MAG TPA: preprotein translocase subunit SecA [Armatimonadota bacterium]|jgi:preprotein translocase subunit SecA
MQNLLRKLWDSNERELKKLQKYVDDVNAVEPAIKALSDDGLREKTKEFQLRVREAAAQVPELADGATNDEREAHHRTVFKAEQAALEEIHAEAFAVVREAARRTLGQRHYDVQVLGGTVLTQGRIAEMKTGEGKTLVATLPIYLNALAGHGVHLVTANDYLSKHGAQWMGPVYHFLGLSVGLIQGASSTAEQGQSPSFLYDPTQTHDQRLYHLRTVGRREAYFADITYGTNNEFGFDYLRDNMAFSHEELVQRDLYFAIVDEVDSILIDEARTPLIIAGMPEDSSEMYYKVDRAVARLELGKRTEIEDKDRFTPEEKEALEKDYTVDEKAKTAMPTDRGVNKLEQMLGVRNLADDMSIMHHVGAALKAHACYRKDIEYVVREGEVVIVDEFTGRLMFGRRYSDGLHQAIEAKEGVKIEAETQTIATITFQNYFRLYSKLAGMTGTAKTEESEFRKIYGLDVMVIPTNRPMIRKDMPDVIYKTEEAKFRGVTAEILKLHCARQPILVGTRSIEVSERLSDRLKNERLQTLGMIFVLQDALTRAKGIDKGKKQELNAILNTKIDDLWVAKLSPVAKELGIKLDPMDASNLKEMARIFEAPELARLTEVLKSGITHNVLNAKYHEREASIIAEAGRAAAVTIATNMAGRGVDILLGGSDVAAVETDEEGEETEEQQDTQIMTSEDKEGMEADRKRRAEEVRQLGGLYIIGTERHESRRIDNQLRGRSGRQGDPGGSRFFLSLEDELWRLFGDRGRRLLERTWDEEAPIEAGMLTAAIERAQKRVEENNFATRKHVLEYDDVMNLQRKVIYGERRRVLDGHDMRETVLSYVQDTVATAVNIHASAQLQKSEWDLSALFDYLNDYFPLELAAQPSDLEGKTHEQLIDFLTETAVSLYESRERDLTKILMRDLERWVVLQVVNSKWVEHLSSMDHLREGVSLRAYGQQDPLVAYKKEAYEMFQALMASIADDVVRYIFRVQVQTAQPAPPPMYLNPLEIGSDDMDMDMDQMMMTGEDPGVAAALARAAAAAGLPPPAAVLADPATIGRNDPCWCGSGKKFKKCHGQQLS